MIQKLFEVGHKQNSLTILEITKKPEWKNATIYKCKCDCGKVLMIKHQNYKTQKHHKGCKLLINEKHFNLKYEPQEASYRAKYANYKSSAKKRNLEFSLTFDEALLLFKSNCKYCGEIPLNNYNAITRNRSYKKSYSFYDEKEYEILYNGLDRVDNNKGYIKNNVVPCCSQCNTAKLNHSLENFKKWIAKVNKTLNNE